METVLHKEADIHVSENPFPHVVIHNAVDRELADTLRDTFPPLSVVAQGKEYGSNERFSLSASKVLESNTIDRAWIDFINAHVSPKFYKQVGEMFGDHIATLYPDIFSSKEEVHAQRTGIRRHNNFSDTDVLLDAQICVNTPVTSTPNSVRGVHADVSNKLFAGLFYLRHPEDRSNGGDLVLYKWKDGVEPCFYKKQFAPEQLVEEVARVPYQHNTLVLFLNSPHSLHGVTPRSATPYPRLFMNLVGEVSDPLFSLVQQQHNPFLAKIRSFIRL